MTPHSPAVGRMVAILNLVAEHPEQSFTLTDIVKSLRLSRATCQAMLPPLVEAGYLYRSRDKTYLLGPTLASIGRIALERFSPLKVARPEMRALADAYDVICSAFFLDQDEIVIRERAASVSHLGWTMKQSVRSRFAAPLGGVFLALSSSAEIEAWLDRASPPLTPAAREDIRRNLAFLREHGYVYGTRKLPLVNEEQARAQLGDASLTNYVVTSIEPDRDYDLAYVIAPVFDAHRGVAFVLGVVGFVRPYSGREIEAIGEQMRQSCDRIEAFITGRSPLPAPDPDGEQRIGRQLESLARRP